MSFHHRYLWSTAFITNILRNEHLSEAATFRYFLAIMAFDWLQFTLTTTAPTPSISLWSTVGSWINFAITVLGLLYLHRKNGGSTGKHFFSRYFPLSITVGWKFVLTMFVVLWLIPVVLGNQSNETLGWSATISISAINIVMLWRIGFHLESLSNEDGI